MVDRRIAVSSFEIDNFGQWWTQLADPRNAFVKLGSRVQIPEAALQKAASLYACGFSCLLARWARRLLSAPLNARSGNPARPCAASFPPRPSPACEKGSTLANASALPAPSVPRP